MTQDILVVLMYNLHPMVGVIMVESTRLVEAVVVAVLVQ